MRCKVLVSYDETREIILAELVQFMNELREGQHSEYDIPVLFDYEKLNQKVRETVVNSKKEFAQFLSYLYCLYRKIEIKLEKLGYPNILPDLNTDEKSFMKICINLDKAKEEYKSMSREDFLELYPVLKKLFFSYIDYIRYSVEHAHNIDDGDYLPETIEEIKPLLVKLNSWSPTKTDKKDY